MAILGGGYVGLYSALELRRRLPGARVTLVSPRSSMTYQPFLPELAAGSLQPSDVEVPLRRALPGVDVVRGRVTGIRHAARRVRVAPPEGAPFEVAYDQLIVGLGSVSRVLPIPGLAQVGLGFRQVEEALALHDRVLGALDAAEAAPDARARRRLLTFVFVGGGFAGVEAVAEVQDMARAALRFHPRIRPDELRFVLVEATGRILPELGAAMGRRAAAHLRARGIDVRLGTTLDSCEDGRVRLSDGAEFDARTVVWTAGIAANPAMAGSDLPLDARGRVRVGPDLHVVGPGGPVAGAWAAGDCAAVPDLTSPGRLCAPSAQHAVRQGRLVGANVARALRGARPRPYRHRNLGALATLGLGKGLAHIDAPGPLPDLDLHGPAAWFLHRSHHVAMMPTVARRLRIVADWTLDLLFRRELAATEGLGDPRAEFRAAARASGR